MPDSRGSDVRIVRVIVASQWVALALGIIIGILLSEGSIESMAAAAAAGIYVLVTTGLPLTVLQRPLVAEAVSLGGSLLTMTAVALTGGVSSPYLLMSVIPPVLATVLAGMRVGIATAVLSASLLIAINISSPEDELVPAVGTGILFIVLVLTVGQIRRILRDIEQRAAQLEATSEASAREVGRLATTNELLTRLAGLASANTGPIAIGRAALETITAIIPGSASTALLTTSTGTLVIAQHGEWRDHPVRTRLPLRVHGREVGAIVLATDEVPTDAQRGALEDVIEPVALSFANLLLLQEIAQTAVEEERSRLARELHDEIGPTLASLGLALDTAALQAGERDIADHLDHLRSTVTELVDDVRATVADLRTDRSGSLSTRLHEAVLQLPNPPMIHVNVDERRPPRPSIMDDVAAVVVEAVRNAHRHSGSDRIRVYGWVDFERGRVVVEDRGSGFDVAEEFPGHFGLKGMHERAQRIGGELTVVSAETGTTVALEWGTR